MNLSEADIAGFFADGQMQVMHFDNSQQLSFPALLGRLMQQEDPASGALSLPAATRLGRAGDPESLLGRLKSSSYCPAEDSPQYPSLVAELAALFEQFAIDAVIDFQYDTELYLGPVAR